MDFNTLFDCLTGTSDETFCKGMIVNVRVLAYSRDVNTNNVPVIIEGCELRSSLPIKDITGNQSADNFYVPEGTILTARIMDIDKENFKCKLRADSRNLNDKSQDPPKPNDYSLEDDPVETDDLSDKKRAEKQVLSRVVVHHLFKNITAEEAEKYLSDTKKDIGEIVIRPSSRGYENLTLSWKFYDGLLIHIDIVEEDKPNRWSLGKKLKIGEETFDDLNEIIVTYVDPIIMHSQWVTKHHKFKSGNRHLIEQALASEKYKDPGSIPYAFGIAHEHPGRFTLYYQPRNIPCREYITPTSKGLRFRGTNFRDMQELILWFKKHYKEQRRY